MNKYTAACFFAFFAMHSQAHDPSSVNFNHMVNAKGLELATDAETIELRRNFNERQAIAAAIESEALINMNRMNALVDEYRINLLISEHLEKAVRQNVRNEDVRNYYDQNQEEFTSRKIKISHILIKRVRDPLLGINSRQIAEGIYSQLVGGDSFAELAAEHSDDRLSSLKGGDLGWVPEGYMNNKFSDAIFSLEEGALSEVFNTPAGHHIVKVEKAAKTFTLPFRTVKEKIRKKLERQAERAELSRLKRVQQ